MIISMFSNSKTDTGTVRPGIILFLIMVNNIIILFLIMVNNIIILFLGKPNF